MTSQLSHIESYVIQKNIESSRTIMLYYILTVYNIHSKLTLIQGSFLDFTL